MGNKLNTGSNLAKYWKATREHSSDIHDNPSNPDTPFVLGKNPNKGQLRNLARNAEGSLQVIQQKGSSSENQG